MVVAAQLIAQVSVQGADKAKSDLTSMGDAATKTGGVFKTALGDGLKLAANVGGAALGFLKDQLVDSVKVAMAHQQVMSQTEAAIKSTGDASGLSASQIENMAASLSKVTPFAENTIQSGQNLLLTFTGIGKTVFPQATQTMLDMAQAMHTGPTQEAMLLGKALNDPTTGLSALTRVGVTFSTQEKEQIQTMMAHNNVAGAQAVMLKELQTEFGGSAKAAGQTFAGALQILKNNLEDVKEKVGSALLPVLSGLVQVVSNTVFPIFDKLGGVFQNVIHYLSLFDLGPITYAWGQLTKAVQDALKPLDGAGGAMKSLSPFLTGLRNDISQLIVSGITKLSGIIGDVANAINGLAGKGGQTTGFLASLASGFKQVAGVALELSPAVHLFQALSAHAKELGEWFQKSVVPAFDQALPGFKNLGSALAGLLPVIKTIADVVHTTFQTAFTALLPVFEKAVPIIIQLAGIIANGLGTAIKFLTPYIQEAVKAIGQFADEIIQRVAPIVMNWFNQLQVGINTFLKLWNAVWPSLAPILQGVWNMIVGVIKVAWALLSGIIKIGLDILSGNWKQAWNDLKDTFVGVWDGIKTYLQGAWQVIKGIFQAAITAVIGIFQHLYDELVGHSIIPDMVNAIIANFVNLKNEVVNWVTQLWNNAVALFTNLKNDAISLFDTLKNGVRDSKRLKYP